MTMMYECGTTAQSGDVVQINEREDRVGLQGALLIVTEVKSWGVQGFISHVTDFDTPHDQIFMRLKWDKIDYIGRAVLVPQDV